MTDNTPTQDRELEALSLAYQNGLIGWYDWITRMWDRLDEIYPLGVEDD